MWKSIYSISLVCSDDIMGVAFLSHNNAVWRGDYTCKARCTLSHFNISGSYVSGYRKRVFTMSLLIGLINKTD